MFSSGYAEIVLIVGDVRVAAEFYRNVVGLIPESPVDEAWAWFWVGEPGVGARLALHKGTLLFEEHSPYPAGQRWGRVHYALRVERGRLDAAVEHVRSAGVPVYGPIRFEAMRAVSYYFYDPDGNLLEWWSPDAEA